MSISVLQQQNKMASFFFIRISLILNIKKRPFYSAVAIQFQCIPQPTRVDYLLPSMYTSFSAAVHQASRTSSVGRASGS